MNYNYSIIHLATVTHDNPSLLLPNLVQLRNTDPPHFKITTHQPVLRISNTLPVNLLHLQVSLYHVHATFPPLPPGSLASCLSAILPSFHTCDVTVPFLIKMQSTQKSVSQFLLPHNYHSWDSYAPIRLRQFAYHSNWLYVGDRYFNSFCYTELNKECTL